MPRYPRLFLPNYPLHIVQRGHDRQAVFAAHADYQFYLDNLAEMRATLEIRVYGYCLMTNHVHLIVAPGDDTQAVSKMLKVLAARQTRRVNKIERRSGTLWEGRFKASLIDSDNYLLACHRYVDLNPVRASIVNSPEHYRWSSYREHAGIAAAQSIDMSPAYTALGSTGATRCRAYREFVAAGINDRELGQIRVATKRNQIIGTDEFRHRIEQRIGRRISARGQGRPKTEK